MQYNALIQGVEIPSFFYPENDPSITHRLPIQNLKSVERHHKVIDIEEKNVGMVSVILKKKTALVLHRDSTGFKNTQVARRFTLLTKKNPSNFDLSGGIGGGPFTI